MTDFHPNDILEDLRIDQEIKAEKARGKKFADELWEFAEDLARGQVVNQP